MRPLQIWVRTLRYYIILDLKVNTYDKHKGGSMLNYFKTLTAGSLYRFMIFTVILFSVGILAAQGTPGLNFTLIDGGTAYEVSRGTASAIHIEIPSIYDGLPVRRIANSAFWYYSSMTFITIPNTCDTVRNGDKYHATITPKSIISNSSH